MANRFTSKLDIIPQGRGRTYVLDRPLVYRSVRYGTLIAPRGFECDLRSIPLGGLGIARPTDYPQAGVIHDWLYHTGRLPREDADRVYLEALLVLGCPAFAARIEWFFLRLFGWRAYRAGGCKSE
jgi:hypothetical protein